MPSEVGAVIAAARRLQQQQVPRKRPGTVTQALGSRRFMVRQHGDPASAAVPCTNVTSMLVSVGDVVIVEFQPGGAALIVHN